MGTNDIRGPAEGDVVEDADDNSVEHICMKTELSKMEIEKACRTRKRELVADGPVEGDAAEDADAAPDQTLEKHR
ncbi:hypothetical protein Syun_016690 [Stephania yunnanensis]|uniref:Uncharacterized protein n=1 Tax=Stephania yunnanensis TaxID=152371 RepID=A0AAP0J7T7_9MAGN